MKAQPTVGLVTPVWNGERYIGEAIDSVLAQDRRVLDYVIVDDGSEDASAEIAEAYGPPVRVVRQTNAGIGTARNVGLSSVRGELVGFLDADDLLTAVSIAARVAVLEADPDIDVVFGAVRRFSELRDGLPVALNAPQPGRYPGAMLGRREVFERIAFPTSTVRGEGLEWLLRAREAGVRERMLADQVLWRRIHGENHSIVHRDEVGEFARTLKASLDRRRAAGELPPRARVGHDRGDGAPPPAEGADMIEAMALPVRRRPRT
jgi:glycosyltransferase involved in cell wall biosynthesis